MTDRKYNYCKSQWYMTDRKFSGMSSEFPTVLFDQTRMTSRIFGIVVVIDVRHVWHQIASCHCWQQNWANTQTPGNPAHCPQKMGKHPDTWEPHCTVAKNICLKNRGWQRMERMQRYTILNCTVYNMSGTKNDKCCSVRSSFVTGTICYEEIQNIQFTDYRGVFGRKPNDWIYGQAVHSRKGRRKQELLYSIRW